MLDLQKTKKIKDICGQRLEHEDDCIPRASIYQGNASSTTLATAGSMSKAVRVNSGTKTTFTIDVPKKGILFMKWSIYGNSGAGGGTFLPPEKVILSRAQGKYYEEADNNINVYIFNNKYKCSCSF